MSHSSESAYSSSSASSSASSLSAIPVLPSGRKPTAGRLSSALCLLKAAQELIDGASRLASTTSAKECKSLDDVDELTHGLALLWCECGWQIRLVEERLSKSLASTQGSETGKAQKTQKSQKSQKSQNKPQEESGERRTSNGERWN